MVSCCGHNRLSCTASMQMQLLGVALCCLIDPRMPTGGGGMRLSSGRKKITGAMAIRGYCRGYCIHPLHLEVLDLTQILAAIQDTTGLFSVAYERD